MQTGFRINSKWQTRYGITYTPKTELFVEYTTDVTSSDGVSIKNEITKNDYCTLPGNLNLGIAFIKNAQNTYTVNAQSQNWGTLNYKGANYQLINSNKLSIGFQHSNTERNYYKQVYERSYFQLGAYAGQSYLKVKNVPITDFGGSIGFGINSRNSPIGLLMALGGGRREASNKNILSENYINLNFTFSYVDVLFSGKKCY